MNTQETKETLGEIKRVYPARFRKMGYQESAQMLQEWEKRFRDVPKAAVEAALERFIKEDAKGFAPEIGQLMRLINADKTQLDAAGENRRRSEARLVRRILTQWRYEAEMEQDEEMLAIFADIDRSRAEYERGTRNGKTMAVAVCDVCEPAGGGAGAGG